MTFRFTPSTQIDLVRFERLPKHAGREIIGVWVNLNYRFGQMFPHSFSFMTNGDDIFHSMKQGMQYGFWSCVADSPIDPATPQGWAQKAIATLIWDILRENPETHFGWLKMGSGEAFEQLLVKRGQAPLIVPADPVVTRSMEPVFKSSISNRQVLVTRNLFDAMDPQFKKRIIDALDADYATPEEAIWAVFDAWAMNPWGIVRVYSLDTDNGHVAAHLYGDMLVLRGGIFRIDPELFPWLLATDADILWDHLKLPHKGCVFDFGATGIPFPEAGKAEFKAWLGPIETWPTEDERYELRGARIVDLDTHVTITFYGFEKRTHEEIFRFYTMRKEPGRKVIDTIEERARKEGFTYPKPLISLVMSAVTFVISESFRGELVQDHSQELKQAKSLKSAAKQEKVLRRAARNINYTMVRANRPLPKFDRGVGGETVARTIARIVSVRGHFKHQPYGPKAENLRKIIWIEPYVRGRGAGDEVGEIAPHLYKVRK